MEKRDFKGVWIPKQIWLDTDLTWMEKLLLVEIESLDNENGCFASNKYFAEFFQVSKPRITQIIKSLEKKGRLKVYLQKEGKRVIKRTIKVVNIFTRGGKYSKQGGKNTKQGVVNILKDNNTTVNNTINNKCVNTQNTPPQEPDEIERPTQDDPIITVTDETGKKIILRDDQIKEHMNIVLNKLPEANIQAEFYHQCRLQKIKCILEYKVENCRFDALVYDENRNVKCIVEFKSYKTRKKPKTNTNQINKYKKFGLPIIMCTRFEDVKWAVEEAKKTLKPKKEKFIPPTETDAANYAEERIREKYPEVQNADQHAESTAEDFINYYGCKNWMVGRTKMKNWKFALNRWIKNNYQENKYNLSYGSANNKDARFGAAKISDIKQALFELDQEKREGVFF